jgi:hypothetical protein
VVHVYVTDGKMCFVMLFCHTFHTFFCIDTRSLPLHSELSRRTFDIQKSGPPPGLGSREMLDFLVPSSELDTTHALSFFVAQYKRLFTQRTVPYIRTLMHCRSSLFMDEWYTLDDKTVSRDEAVYFPCVSLHDYYIHQHYISDDVLRYMHSVHTIYIQNMHRSLQRCAATPDIQNCLRQQLHNVHSRLSSVSHTKQTILSAYLRIRQQASLYRFLPETLRLLFDVACKTSSTFSFYEHKMYFIGCCSFHIQHMTKEMPGDRGAYHTDPSRCVHVSHT